jgi:hypothetical protein
MSAQRSIPDTLGNLSPEHRIHGDCRPCDRHFDVPLDMMIARLGPSCQTIEAMKRVTCSECGHPNCRYTHHECCAPKAEVVRSNRIGSATFRRLVLA